MLVRTKDRRFHFRHHTDEDGTRNCPISTRGEFSADQINKMKYNAAKESTAHLRLKAIIRDSLWSSRFSLLGHGHPNSPAGRRS